MRRILLAVVLILFAVAIVRAQELKMNAWQTQSQNVADGKVGVSGDIITLSRGDAGTDKYMLRAYQDVTVVPETIYQFSYKIKVEGKGVGTGLIIKGNKQGKWENSNIQYAPRKKECDFTEVKINVPAGENIVKFRLDLRANGANTKVIYKDIKLDKVGAKQDITLEPREASVKLDGKLDDPLWKDAVKLSPFKVLGNVSRDSKVSNEAMLAVKDGYLYIAYRMEEPNVSGMKITKMENTAEMSDTVGIYADDCAETFISPDQLSYSHLLVNPAGVKHWQQKNIGKPATTWYPTEKSDFTGNWEAAASVGEKEWTCEMRIKLSSLFGEDKDGKQQLFVNFTRHRTQGDEPNLTLAPLSGKFYSTPKEFLPITLLLPPVPTRKAKEVDIVSEFTNRLSVPELLLAGKPVKLVKNQGKFELASKVKIDDKNGNIDSGVKKQLNEALISPQGSGSINVVLNTGDVFSDSALSSDEQDKLKSPEAFKLELTTDKAVITGRTKEGLLRGIASLILLSNRARFLDGVAIPTLVLYDAPGMELRGWLVGEYDPSAVKKMIDTAYLLRFNQIFIMLDSFGGPTMFPFDCLPIGSKKSTKQDWVDVFNYARVRGVEPIPYFSSWGRVQYLKNMAGGAKLLVDDVDVIQKTYRNLDVANPETHKVMLQLQEEIIDTLKPQGFCIAMDETHYGHTVSSPAAKAKNWKPSDWFVEAVNVNDAFFKKKGIKMYIYGDMLDPGYNGKQMDMAGSELLKRLPKDMIVLDWKYDGKQDYKVDFPSVKMFKDAGLKTIGSPWYRPKNIPRLAYSIKRHNAEGVCLTSWNTTRIDQLKPELIRALALTAYYSWSPDDCDLEHLKFVPDAIMEGAAYWNKVKFPAVTVTPVKVDGGLIGGNELIKMFGLPAGTGTTFIGTPFENYRGVKFKTFTKDGKPAAIVIAGRPDIVMGEVVNGDFSVGTSTVGWQIENNGGGSFSVENGTLKVVAPEKNAFMRVFQDIILNQKKEYVLRYKVKVDGAGTANAWTYSGDEKFKWDNSKIIYSNSKNKEWETKQVQLPPGHASVRICFAANGTSSVAYYDDIELAEKGAGTVVRKIESGNSIAIGDKARVITFMHATNRQALAEDMAGMYTQFAKSIPGEYVVIYENGEKSRIPLSYRVNVAAVNDSALGREMDIGLFGTVGHTVFMNLPTFTWLNPHPEKIIKSIEILPGNSKEMSLLVFGISLDNNGVAIAPKHNLL